MYESIIINYLKLIKYDYLPLPVGDGVTDDSDIIQAREKAGLNCLVGSKGSSFLISKTIYIGN